jgi:hypothetical protein
MNKEVVDLLNQVLANQVALFKRLEEIEIKIKGGMRSAPDESYVRDLKTEAAKYLKYIR